MCEAYLLMHEYGLNVRAPKRQTVSTQRFSSDALSLSTFIHPPMPRRCASIMPDAASTTASSPPGRAEIDRHDCAGGEAPQALTSAEKGSVSFRAPPSRRLSQRRSFIERNLERASTLTSQ